MRQEIYTFGAKTLGWNDKTVVKVYVEDEKIVIEKIAQL